MKYMKEEITINDIKITPPDGYEIDKNKSTFNSIKFKLIEKYENIVEQPQDFKNFENLIEYNINNQ